MQGVASFIRDACCVSELPTVTILCHDVYKLAANKQDNDDDDDDIDNKETEKLKPNNRIMVQKGTKTSFALNRKITLDEMKMRAKCSLFCTTTTKCIVSIIDGLRNDDHQAESCCTSHHHLLHHYHHNVFGRTIYYHHAIVYYLLSIHSMQKRKINIATEEERERV